MPAYSFRAVGTVSGNTGTSPDPAQPAGRVAGDLLLAIVAARATTVETLNTPTGWTVLFDTAKGLALLGRIATNDANDNITAFDFFAGGSSQNRCQIAAFSGDVYTNLSTIVAHSVSASSTTNHIPHSALTITTDNCLVISGGKKAKTTTSDPLTLTDPSEVGTRIGFTTAAGGTSMADVWNYVQQTTAANIAAGTWTMSTNEGLAYASFVVALKTAPSGAMTGSADLSFTSTAGALAGAGALSGASAITFTPAAAPTGAGALSGASAITFTPVGALKGAGALSGAAALTFSPAGTLLGAGALAGAAAITFTPVGALKGAGALAGAAAFTFSPTAALTGAGALAGTTSITFTPAAVLTGAGALTGAAPISFTPSANLAGAGALSGTTAVTFTPDGTLTGLAQGDLAGAASLTFTPTATLQGSGTLTGSTDILFGATGILTALSDGSIIGLASITFSASGALTDISAAPELPLGGMGPMSPSVGYQIDRLKKKRKKPEPAPVEVRISPPPVPHKVTLADAVDPFTAEKLATLASQLRETQGLILAAEGELDQEETEEAIALLLLMTM